MADSRRQSPGHTSSNQLIFTSGIAGQPSTTDPLYLDPAACQTARVFDQLQSALEPAGGSLRTILALTQYFADTKYAGPYIRQRRRLLDGPLPASTGLAVRGLIPATSLVAVEAIAAAADPAEVKYVTTDDSPVNAASGYSQAVACGDWLFCAGAMASDYLGAGSYPGARGTGLAEAARSNLNYWNAFPMRDQLRYIIDEKLSPVLVAGGSSVGSIAVAHVLLLDWSHLPAFREAWMSLFDEKPPLTQLTVATGLGTLGGLVEVAAIAVRDEALGTVEDVVPPLLPGPFGFVSEARRVADYVFTATQSPADETGRLDLATSVAEDPCESQMQVVVARLKSIASSAGGRLSDIARIRIFVGDRRDAAMALRVLHEHLGGSPAVSLVVADQFAGSVSADAVFRIPQEASSVS